MSRPEPSFEYEKITQTFKRKDGEYFCCYCGSVRAEKRTNLDHVPGVGVFKGEPPNKTPTVRVCIECNQKQSPSEAYFYCILSAVLSGSPKPKDQVLPSAKKVLSNDKRMRRKISQSNLDWPQNLNWTVDNGALLPLFSAYARGHLFLQNATLELQEPSSISVYPIPLMIEGLNSDFFSRNGDGWLEVGTKGFIEQALMFGEADQVAPTETEIIDSDGFNIVSPSEYRFRVGHSFGHTYVKMIFHEYLAVEVRW